MKNIITTALMVLAFTANAQNPAQTLTLPTLARGGTFYNLRGVISMKVDSATSTLFISGGFGSVGGQTRVGIAAINLDALTVTSWSSKRTNVFNVAGALEVTDSIVYYSWADGVSNSITGEQIVAVNKFTGDTLTGYTTPTINAYSNYQYSVNTLKQIGSYLYVGGYFPSVTSKGITSINSNIVRIDAKTGAVDTTWKPNFNEEVREILLVDNSIFVGGYFTQVDGQTRNGVAVLNTSTGLLTSTNYGFTQVTNNNFGNFLKYKDYVIAGGFGYNLSRLAKNGTKIERSNSSSLINIGLGSFTHSAFWARGNGTINYIEVIDSNMNVLPINTSFPSLAASPTAFATHKGKVFFANYTSNTSSTTKFFRGFQFALLDTAKLSLSGSLCSNTPLTVSVKAEGSFEAGNQFIAEISDASGSFSNPISIGTLSNSFQGATVINIPSTIPSLPNGNQYRVRVRSTSPQSVGFSSASIIQITGCTSVTPDSIYIRKVSNNSVYKSNAICDTASVFLEATYTNSANQLNNTGYTWNIPSSWVWLDTLNYPKNGRVVKVKPVNGSFPVSVTAFNGCGAAQPKNVTISSNLQVINPTNIRIISDQLCLDDTIRMVADLSSNTLGQNYQWSVGSAHNIILGGTQNKDTVLSIPSNGMAGNIHSMNLRVFNECGVGTQLNLPYQVFTVPQFGFNNTVLGTRRICSPDTINLTVSGYNYASVDSFLYTIKSGSIPITPTVSALPTFSFFATSSDTVEVRVKNYCGTTPGWLKHILSFTTPVDSIFSQDSVCAGGNPIFSLYPPNNNFDSAFWTYPTGWNTQFFYDNYNMRVDRSLFALTNSYVSVNGQNGGFAGSYPFLRYQSGLVSVTAYNPCGVYQFSKYINVTNYPFPTGLPNNSVLNMYSTIDSAFCMLDPFTIDALSDTSITRYNWFLPVGWSSIGDTTSSSITVQSSSMVSDTIRYQPTNRCYNSLFRYPKVIYPSSIAPSSPDSISVIGSSCIGDTIALQASFVNNARAYVWEVPAAWTVVGKTDSSLIRVIATTEDSIRVRAVNSCDTSSSSNFKTIELIPADNIITSASDSVTCKGGVIAFSSSGGQSYFWQGLGQSSTDSVVQFSINSSGKVVATVLGNCKQLVDTFNVKSLDELVWPGDANSDKVVNQNDILAIGIAYGESGPLRLNASSIWVDQCAESWMNSFNTGENFAHADADGNGIVNHDDTLLVSLNFGKVHAKNSAERSGSIPLAIEFDKTSYAVGDTVTGSILLGTSIVQAIDVYGIAAAIDFGLKIKVNSLQFNQSGSWLTQNIDLIFERSMGNQNIVFAQSRTNKQNLSGQGAIANFSFVADSNTVGQKAATISEVLLLNAQNDTLGSTSNPLNFTFTNTISSIDDVKDFVIKVYPNPALNFAQVEISKDINNATFTLFDMAGKAIKTIALQEGATTVGLHEVAAGLYHYNVAVEGVALGRGSLVVGR